MAAGIPDELWDKILKDLPLTDVNSMTRVSKAINRVAYPFLYRDLKLLVDPKSPLLHTLIQNPEHAESVRHLVVNFCDNSFICSTENELKQNIFGQDKLVEKKVYSPCDEIYKITPVIRRMQSLHSLGLCQTAKLPVLDFMRGIGATEFSGLKHFSLDHLWDGDYYAEKDLPGCPFTDRPWFQLSDLPQAEEIELEGIQFGNPFKKEGDDEPTLIALSKPSITKKLKIDTCDISSSDLNVLLSHYTNLTSLECSIPLEVEYVQKWFDLSQITEGLLMSQKTLQYLSFQLYLSSYDYPDVYNHYRVNHGIRSSLTSLKGFTQLRTLEVEYATIMGWNIEGCPTLSHVLPPNLEKLTLTRSMGESRYYQWDNFIEEDRVGPWLQEYLKSAQCLKEVILHVPETLPDFRLHERFIPKVIKVTIEVDDN
ncbi:hypothetical protein BS50DRAFT_639460 [Corynespora cassiicola Philippines]|uniref:F-box domain-containing protein n=1 Tax=Corynespora cassiicola Philippines TaxID=1448308 RepID=A0A2T2N857_CORCC|nr:hypothetical protein BS50DRAFT_639460 [Corynespora cassiicola Philippines]